MQAWRSTHERSYNWAAKGRSAEQAAWVQPKQLEAATYRGKSSASALVDLTKAYELVCLSHVWEGLAKKAKTVVVAEG